MSQQSSTNRWPVDLVRDQLDGPVKSITREQLETQLRNAGAGAQLAAFLSPLYGVADGGTFYDGAFRLIPLRSSKKKHHFGLIDWNVGGEWQQYAPAQARSTFFFASNVFGDLFGIPVDANLNPTRDCVGILWTEKYRYEETGANWSDTLTKMLTEPHIAEFLCRLKEYEWAAEDLGQPEPWQCFSSKMPALLGGSDSIDNVEVRLLTVHVDFTLQLLAQSVSTGDNKRKA